MSTHIVIVDGCDDTTFAAVTLTESEAEVVREVAARVTASSDVGCKPKMRLTAWVDASDYERELAAEVAA